jgi:HlyD family secretion protein
MSEQPEPLPPEPPRRRGRTAAVIAVSVALASIIAARFLRRGDDVRHLTAKVERGDILDAVDATGKVDAVTTVQVGSQVSGTIARLNADFNSQVRKDDVVALIDPRLLEGALRQAESDLENARAAVLVAEANVTKARAALVQTKADYGRAGAMQTQGVGTDQALDLAKANYESARASVDAAVANVAQSRAEVQQKEAAVSVARTNLAYTVIRSPIDGTVVARNVDVGQTVAASLQAPTIFTIAQDLTKMLVYAKVDESDVGRIRTNQPVTFKVDAFPKQVFTGRVIQVRMNPTTVQNVVTYDAVVEFENPDRKLFPGMTGYVTIPVARATGVVKVPNAALRYKPPMDPDSVRAEYAKYGIRAVSDDRTEPESGAAVVWKRRSDGRIEPVRIAVGITDHTFTEVKSVLVGTLGQGDDVVTSTLTAKGAPPGPAAMRR